MGNESILTYMKLQRSNLMLSDVEYKVARCAIFPPNLAIFLFGWRVKFAFGGWRIFWLFSKYFGGKFGGFLYKILTRDEHWTWIGLGPDYSNFC